MGAGSQSCGTNANGYMRENEANLEGEPLIAFNHAHVPWQPLDFSVLPTAR